MIITVIGAGNMGGALLKGWAKTSAELKLRASAKTQKTLDNLKSQYPSIETYLDNRAAVESADIVVLAVKPWLVMDVLREIVDVLDFSKQIVVSVAANVKIDSLSGCGVYYAMPNIAAEYGESMTFINAPSCMSSNARDYSESVSTTDESKSATEDSKSSMDESNAKVEYIFSLLGKTMFCSETILKTGMMMAGCGIAYVIRFLRAMMEGGVEMGLYPSQAQEIAQQTMLGAVKLLQESGLHPEAAIDKVTTPGGVTIKGLNELDHANFNSAVIRCLKAGLK